MLHKEIQTSAHLLIRLIRHPGKSSVLQTLFQQAFLQTHNQGCYDMIHGSQNSQEARSSTPALVHSNCSGKKENCIPIARKLYQEESLFSNRTDNNTRDPLACLDMDSTISWQRHDRSSIANRKRERE
jgi:hypothetical protein